MKIINKNRILLYFTLLNFEIKINISRKNKNKIIKWNLQNIDNHVAVNKYINTYADDDGFTNVRYIFHNPSRRWAFFKYLQLHPEIDRIEIIDYLYTDRNTLFERTPSKYICYDQDLLLGFQKLGYTDAVNYLIYFKNIQ